MLRFLKNKRLVFRASPGNVTSCLRYRALFWLGLCLLSPSAVFGADENKLLPTQGRQSWDAATGFTGGEVYSMTQTGDGYLWIGTSKGLVRYDGLTFVPIRESDSPTDPRPPVFGLVTDLNDQLWAIDDHSRLYRYSGEHQGKPMAHSGERLPGVSPLNRSYEGWLLYLSQPQGLIEYKSGEARVLLDASRIPNAPTAVAQAKDGTYWIGTRDAGVYHLNVIRGALEIQQVAGLPHVKANCLLPIGGSTLLVGTDTGLLSIHNGKLIQKSLPQLDSLEVHALANGSDGAIWIGTDNGLFRAEARDIETDGKIHSVDRLPMRFPVSSLFEDRAGNLWIGGPEIIERYRASGFAAYLSSAGLPSSNSGPIYVDDQESLWFAPWNGGLYRLAQGSIQPIDVAPLKTDSVYSLTGGAGEIWAGRKEGGVTRFRLSGPELQTSTYTQRDGLAENTVYSIYRAPDGTVWAGTLNGGLSRFRNGEWHTFTTRDGLPSNTILAIVGNASGEIVVGTSNGVAELRNNRWQTYATHDGIPPGMIEGLFLDDTGTLWVGTARGISFLQSGSVHVPVHAPEALYGEILGITGDHDWLWITTNKHVLRVRASALLNDSFAAGDYRDFGVADGLPSSEGVKRSGSVVKDSRGRVWLSLNQGISVFQPSAFIKPALPVTIRMDGILVDGKRIGPGENVRVPAGRRRLTFQYAGVEISTPEALTYRYRLDNVDSAWSEPTTLREIDYTNVPPGRFRFEVTARDADGRWSGRETTMTFEVEPAYWQTQWFQLASVAMLGLLAWGLYRWRLRQVSARMDIRYHERLEERTRIARDLHDTLLQSFQGLMLRLQVVNELLPNGRAKEQLEQTLERGDQAIVEGRSAVHDLRSPATVTTDLAQAVRALGGELSLQDSAEFHLVVEGSERDLHPIIRDELYRITREALQNAFSHASARRIETEITFGDRAFRLRIRDDGEGIPPEILDGGRPGHYGLTGMRERAKQIGGKLEIWSAAKAGTEIELTIAGSIAYRTLTARPFFRLFRKKTG